LKTLLKRAECGPDPKSKEWTEYLEAGVEADEKFEKWIRTQVGSKLVKTYIHPDPDFALILGIDFGSFESDDAAHVISGDELAKTMEVVNKCTWDKIGILGKADLIMLNLGETEEESEEEESEEEESEKVKDE
jgi:hypothetical protein